MSTEESTTRIRDLNDQFRRTLVGGRILMTAGVSSLPEERIARLVAAVRSFDMFTEDNDPHGEHDFGSLDDGHTYFWKIDYYAPGMVHGSEDPADPSKTVRVLTLMRADEY